MYVNEKLSMATGMIVFMLQKTLIIAFQIEQHRKRQEKNRKAVLGYAVLLPYFPHRFFAAFLPTKRLEQCILSQNKSLVHSCCPIGPLNGDLIQSTKEGSLSLNVLLNYQFCTCSEFWWLGNIGDYSKQP